MGDLTVDEIDSHYDERIQTITCPSCGHVVTPQALGPHVLMRELRCLRVLVRAVQLQAGMDPGRRDLSPGFVGGAR